ncbi:hypothetical protein RI129_003754 [Pyrocoelia pectoralis]|uniref:AAA+ ATPase domain-containing protein n=1 Tax=Pyrocoelia pectoralis TaxID=417401 RepID=A0AAN7ZNC9_9COLE
MDVYKNAVKFFEQLLCAVQAEECANNGTLTHIIENCSNQILTLCLQLNVRQEEMTDFERIIETSLRILQQQLSQLKNKLQQKSNSCNPQSGLALLRGTDSKTATNKNITFFKTTPKVKGLNEIAGLDEVKRTLTTTILLPLHQPQLFLGRKISNSLLLFGPPGTGKTHIAHAIAAEASANFYSVSSSDIFSELVGGTEKAISALFNMVKEEKNCTLLFFDEIDGLCQHRHSNETEFNRRVKTELMMQFSNFEDCPNKFLICATNCPWDLDSAILRRFQNRIYVPLPNKEERLELLKLLTKDTTLENDILWEAVLEQTEGFSGSDLTDLLRNAKNRPIMELLDTVIWQRTSDDKFSPINYTDATNFENLIHCKLSEVPSGCVQTRPMNILDVMEMLNTIRPTVPVSQIVKYETFVN